MRHHLADLRKAGLIHYSIGQRVYVGFVAVNGCGFAPRIPRITDERMTEVNEYGQLPARPAYKAYAVGCFPLASHCFSSWHCRR